MTGESQGNRKSSRYIDLDFVGNLRELGGCPTRNGSEVVRRKVFRSGELRHKTGDDVALLKRVTGVASALDLRSSTEIEEDRVKLLEAGGICFQNIPQTNHWPIPGLSGVNEFFSRFSSMGECYVNMLEQEVSGKRLVDALEFIAEPRNHPVLFYCSAGKDRTGILSAALLNILGVADEDVIADYHMTTPHMETYIKRMRESTRTANMTDDLPDYAWHASRESMALLLSKIRHKYGSFRGYAEAHGGDSSLFERLEKVMLVETR